MPRAVLLSLLLFSGGCSGPAAAASLPGPSETAGARALYTAKCAKCHKFYDPAKYSEQDWKMWMGKMSRKAKLKPEQEQTLSQYIEQYLRAPRKPEAK